jgi:MmyB-like transcription regulator ligand binding domain
MACKKVAGDPVLLLSARAGRHPYDRRLSDLSGSCTPKRRIRVRWAALDVQIRSTGVQLIHHPVVDGLDLWLESLPLAGRFQPDAPRVNCAQGVLSGTATITESGM